MRSKTRFDIGSGLATDCARLAGKDMRIFARGRAGRGCAGFGRAGEVVGVQVRRAQAPHSFGLLVVLACAAS